MVGDLQIVLSVLAGVIVLLFFIIKLKLPAFLSLLIASIVTGLLAGLSGQLIIDTIQKGMSSTLGFVATVVGLGALFGGILKLSGGAKSIAQKLLLAFGEKRSGYALGLTGFLVAIPVFFDVAFIILIPVIYAIQNKTKKSLLHYAIPLLSGLAITHSFIPPTPGPIAVADIIGADLGWVMLIGFATGVPTLIASGILFGKYIGHKIHVDAPSGETNNHTDLRLPKFSTVISIIMIPIILIMLATLTKSDIINISSQSIRDTISLVGHPFVALIIANIIAWYLLGRGGGYTSQELLGVSTKSFKPAGIIILLTGAGGVFKQMLVSTKAGEIMATGLAEFGMSIIFFSFIAAAIVRIVQGSATVAMITAAGLVAPLLVGAPHTPIQLAALVIAIASGASIFSHVNDSGFWLVKEYLGLTEKQTLRSWTMMTTILALVGFSISIIVYYLAA
jgi:Gnt-I system low-affinity gluconate transporter